MNEIEEFLKRAAAMRARQQGAAAPAPTPPRSAPTRPPQSTASIRRPPTTSVQDAEVIEAEEVTVGDDVAEHVARHLSSRTFSERASHLGEDIKAADEVLESHLHETFEHKLGSLGATTARADDSTLDEDELQAAKAAQPPSSAQSLLNMLRSPQNLRNTIILSEILNPPYSRW